MSGTLHEYSAWKFFMLFRILIGNWGQTYFPSKIISHRISYITDLTSPSKTKVIKFPKYRMTLPPWFRQLIGAKWKVAFPLLMTKSIPWLNIKKFPTRSYHHLTIRKFMQKLLRTCKWQFAKSHNQQWKCDTNYDIDISIAIHKEKIG